LAVGALLAEEVCANWIFCCCRQPSQTSLRVCYQWWRGVASPGVPKGTLGLALRVWVLTAPRPATTALSPLTSHSYVPEPVCTTCVAWESNVLVFCRVLWSQQHMMCCTVRCSVVLGHSCARHCYMACASCMANAIQWTALGCGRV